MILHIRLNNVGLTQPKQEIAKFPSKDDIGCNMLAYAQLTIQVLPTVAALICVSIAVATIVRESKSSSSGRRFGQRPGTSRRPDATSHRERLEDGSGRSVALRPERLATETGQRPGNAAPSSGSSPLNSTRSTP